MIKVVCPELRTASICLGVGFGSRHDPRGGSGLAHVLEHALMSLPMKDGVSVCERVEQLGGTANAETGLEQMLFYARVHARDCEEIVSRLVDAVVAPCFDLAAFERERGVVLRELAGAAADDFEVVQDAVLSALFPGHPLGRPVGGIAGEVGSLTLETVAAAHHDFFSRRDMALAVAGPDGLGPGLQAAGSAWPGTSRQDSPGLPPPLRGRPGGWPEGYAWACFGARSPRAGDPGVAAYRVLAELCGQSACSLLYRRFRNELGLAYHFQSWNRAYSEAGAWRLLVGVDAGAGEAIADAVQGTWQELANAGPGEADLAASRRQVEMKLIEDAEDPLRYAQVSAERLCSGHAMRALEDEFRDIQEVTAGQVAAAAGTVLRDHVLVVSPPAGGPR